MLLFKKVADFMDKLLQNYKIGMNTFETRIWRILLKHVSDHLVLFQFAWLYF